MCPSAFQEHLDLHVAWLQTYDLPRQEMDELVDRKVMMPSGGTADTGVGAASKRKGPHTRSRPGGKNTRGCRRCDRALTNCRTEQGCWYNPKRRSPKAVARREAAAARAQFPGRVGPSKGQGKAHSKDKRGERCVDDPGESTRGS